MKFRKSTTYNTHDSTCLVDDRINIGHDVPRRCELSLRRVINAGREGITLSALTDLINHDRNCLYSESDIRYALSRLQREGLVRQFGKDLYKASQSALNIWKQLKSNIDWV